MLNFRQGLGYDWEGKKSLHFCRRFHRLSQFFLPFDDEIPESGEIVPIFLHPWQLINVTS